MDIPDDQPPGPESPSPGPDPLSGVRVVDLGHSWAAPFAGMLLADLGADVIRVESHHHIDILRWSAAFLDGVRDHERSGYYMACNRGKRSVTLNLKSAGGRDLLLGLVQKADVLLENFSPRVMGALGLGPEVLFERNPRLVLLSMSGYGATGPEADRAAYGDHLLHASGFSSLTGHPDDPPALIGTFYGDPVAGLYGALAVLAALERVRAGGPGERLEYSQLEGLVSLIPGAFVAASTGVPAGRHGARSDTAVPHGFYRCAGDDTWVAIAVVDDERWSRFAGLIGWDPARAPSLAARRSMEDDLDEAVAAWTAPRSPWEVTDACQAAGVAAHPVMNAQTLLMNDHLAERRFFRWVHRPLTGPAPIPGVAFRVAGEGARVRGPAPTMGQHTDRVLTDLLGLDPAALEQLKADGALD